MFSLFLPCQSLFGSCVSLQRLTGLPNLKLAGTVWYSFINFYWVMGETQKSLCLREAGMNPDPVHGTSVSSYNF